MNPNETIWMLRRLVYLSLSTGFHFYFSFFLFMLLSPFRPIQVSLRKWLRLNEKKPKLHENRLKINFNFKCMMAWECYHQRAFFLPPIIAIICIAKIPTSACSMTNMEFIATVRCVHLDWRRWFYRFFQVVLRLVWTCVYNTHTHTIRVNVYELNSMCHFIKPCVVCLDS